MDCDSVELLAEVTEDIGRGHAEVLMGQIDACLHEANRSYSDLTRVAVTVGPGSFTGVRVGLAAARGLALGLDVQIIGVSTLDAAERHAMELGATGPIAVLLDAKRDQAFCKLPDEQPQACSYDALLEKLVSFDGVLCGSGAHELNSRTSLNLPVVHTETAIPIATIARLALEQEPSDTPPEPLYLRSADAKKQSGFALPRIGA